MTLDQLVAISTRITVGNLEKAYYDVVKKMRLRMSFVPCIMKKATAKVDEFSQLVRHNDTVNDISLAIKEISKPYGVGIPDTSDTISYVNANDADKGTLEIGIPCATYQGFTEDEFTKANRTDVDEDRDLIPEIYIEDRLIICTNFDEYDSANDSYPFFWLFCYIYPYLCTSSTVDKSSRYDISAIAEIDQQYYTVDNTLLFPVITKALAFYYQDEGDMVQATHYDNATIQYIQIYNGNIELPFCSPFTNIGSLEAGVF